MEGVDKDLKLESKGLATCSQDVTLVAEEVKLENKNVPDSKNVISEIKVVVFENKNVTSGNKAVKLENKHEAIGTVGVELESENVSKTIEVSTECKKLTSRSKDVKTGCKNVTFGTNDVTSDKNKVVVDSVPDTNDVKQENKDSKLSRWSLRRGSLPLVSIRNALLKRRNLSPDNLIWRRR